MVYKNIYVILVNNMGTKKDKLLTLSGVKIRIECIQWVGESGELIIYNFYLLGYQNQILIGSFEIDNKMSSLAPFTFKAVDLHILTINDKLWTRATKVCKALGYSKNSKIAIIIKQHRSKKNFAHKYKVSSVHALYTPVDWPKDSQKYDLYVNNEGMYETLL